MNRCAPDSRACRLLLGLVSSAETDCGDGSLDEEAWQQITCLAAWHDLCPLLYRRVRDRELRPPDSVMSDLHVAHLKSVARAEHMSVCLDRVLTACTQAGVAVLLVRGAWLAVHAYEHASLRPMSDIDLVVRDEDLRRASRALRAAGLIGRHAPVALDLHTVRSMPGVRTVRWAEQVWDRAVSTSIAGHSVRVPEVHDHVLLIAAHLALHHGFGAAGLKGLYDLHRLIESEALDWTLLSQRSEVAGLSRALSLTLCLCHSLLATTVPQGLRTCDGKLCAQAIEQLVASPLPGPSLSPVFVRLLDGRRSCTYGPRRPPQAAPFHRARRVLARLPVYIRATLEATIGAPRMRERLARARRSDTLREWLSADTPAATDADDTQGRTQARPLR